MPPFTRSKTTRPRDNTAFKNLAQGFALHTNASAAFEYITNIDQQGEGYALGILQALHASSVGPDQQHALAYVAPGISPATSWRAGPPGGATILQLASNLIDNPDDMARIMAFDKGLQEQGTVIQELLHQKTAKLEEPGEYITGRDKFNELLAKQPRDVRARLLQVYDKLFKAKQILNEFQGYRPLQLDLTEETETSGAAALAAGANTSPSPALAATLNELFSGRLAEYFQPVLEGMQEEIKELRAASAEASHKATTMASLVTEWASKSSSSSEATEALAKMQKLEAQAAKAKDETEGIIAELQAENERLRAASKGATHQAEKTPVRIPAPTPATATSSTRAEEGIYRKLAELEGKLHDVEAVKGAASKDASDEMVRHLLDENARMREELASSRQGAASPSQSRLMSARTVSARSGVSPGMASGIDSKSIDVPEDMPSAVDWHLMAPKNGLEKAKPADFVSAWKSRPAAGNKSAKKQLTNKVTSETMLNGLPATGDISAYKIVRGPMLEKWFIYANVINDGGEAGEASLLRALVECATNQYNANKTEGKTESHWRGLMEAKSVLRFLEELDGLFADRSHTASEQEWETAVAEAHDAFDLYLRIRHLLTTTETRIRGFNLLVKYLSGKGDKIGVHKLHDCGTEDPSKWHEALDSLRAVDKQIPEASTKGRRVNIDTSGNKLLGLSGTKTKTTTEEDDRTFTQGNLFLDADTTLYEHGILAKTLIELRESQKKNENNMGELRKQLAALSSGGSQTPPLTPAPSTAERFKTFAPSYAGGPAKVYDLSAIYSFLNIGDAPPRHGQHPGGTHGEDCKVCSKYLGFTTFQSYDTLKGLGQGSNARAYHNAWKCSKIPTAVKMEAAKVGAPQSKVDELLKVVDDPFWKPRGA